MTDELNKLKDQKEIARERGIKAFDKIKEIEGRGLGGNAKLGEEARKKLGIDKNDKRTGTGYFADLEKAERENEEKQSSLINARNKVVNDPNTATVFEISGYTDDTGKILNITGKGTPLKSLLSDMCVHFSNFDNPFLSSYTSAQKKELLESITGRAQVLNTGPASNPTPYSFEWFQHWWEYFQNYADEYIFYETSKKLNEEPNAYVDPHETSYTKKRIVQRFRDVAKMIKAVRKDNTSYVKKDRALQYLYNADKLLKVLISENVPGKIPSSVGVLDINKTSFYPSDFMHLIEVCFPESTRDSNLLLNRGTSKTDYRLGPDWMQSVTFDNMAIQWWHVKKKANSMESKDHEEHIWEGLVSVKHVEHQAVKVSNPIMVKVAGAGIKPFFDAFHEIFKPTVQAKFAKVFRLRSIKKGGNFYIGNSNNYVNENEDSIFLREKKLYGLAFSSGELAGIVSLEEIKAKIEIEEKNLQRSKLSEEVNNPELERAKAEWAEFVKLEDSLALRIENLTGNNLGEIRKQIKSYEIPFNNIDTQGNWLNNKNKRPWSYFDGFKRNYEKLEKLVDPSKPTKEEKDLCAKFKLFEKVVNPIIVQITSFYNERGDKPKKQWLEEFCKDTSNRERIRGLLESLEKLNRNISLDPDSRELFNNLKKVEVGQDLRGYLKRILKPSHEAKYDDLLKAWRTDAFYGKDENLYNLIYKYLESNNFLAYLKQQIKTTEAKVIDWFVTKDTKEKIEEVVDAVRHYEIYQWAKLSNNERSGKTPEEKKKALDVFTEYINKFAGKSEYAIRSFETSKNFSEITNDKLAELYLELRDSINKELKEALGNLEDAAKVIEWSKLSSFNDAEKVKAILPSAEKAEKFKAFAGNDSKETIKNNSAKDAAAIFIRFANKELGLTEEFIKQVKITDKPKLEEASKNFAYLTELGVITGPEKTIQTLISSQLGKLGSTPTTPLVTPPTTADDKKDETSTDTNTNGNGKSEDKNGKKPWYEFGGYMIAWLPALLLIGAGVWYFFLRNSEDKKEEEESEK